MKLKEWGRLLLKFIKSFPKNIVTFRKDVYECPFIFSNKMVKRRDFICGGVLLTLALIALIAGAVILLLLPKIVRERVENVSVFLFFWEARIQKKSKLG